LSLFHLTDWEALLMSVLTMTMAMSLFHAKDNRIAE